MNSLIYALVITAYIGPGHGNSISVVEGPYVTQQECQDASIDSTKEFRILINVEYGVPLNHPYVFYSCPPLHKDMGELLENLYSKVEDDPA